MAESIASDFEAGDEEWTFLTVLGKGITFEYVVPSFPVFRANLTELKLQCANRKGSGGSRGVALVSMETPFQNGC